MIRHHGRTTAIDHHADLQVLKRIRQFLLPKDFTVSEDLLNEMAQGYDKGDPLADELLAANYKFAKPLQAHIISEQSLRDTTEPLSASSKTESDIVINGEALNGNTLNGNTLNGNTLNDNALNDNALNDNALNDNTLNNNALNNNALNDNANYQQLVDQFSSHPEWFDADLAEIGAIAYRRYPLMLIWLLRNVALMAGYSIPALSLPLTQTGALVHDALPRLMRTYSYILAVSEHPQINGADSVLAIGSEGWRQSISVRQIHAIVRQKLLKQGWDTAYWGTPINQTDMVATHLQFSLLIMRGLRLLGARITQQEAKGILHLWHLASWWMGIDLKRLPDTETQCWEWIYTYLATQHLDFEVGKPLADALHRLPSEIMGEDNKKGRFVELVNASVTRTLVGDDIGDGLGLPKSKLRHGVLISVPILFGIDTLRRHNAKAATKLETFRAKRQNNMNWWLREHDSYYRK